MRGRSLLFSLLIHGFVLTALIFWSSSALLRPPVKEVVLPIEVSALEEITPKVKKEIKPKPQKPQRPKAVKKTKPKPKVKRAKPKARSRPKPKLRTSKVVKEELKAKELPPAGAQVKEAKVAGVEEKPPPLPGEGNKAKKVNEVKEAKGRLKTPELPPPPPKEPQFNPLDYKRLVVAALEKNKFYPPLAKRLGIEGSVEVEITVNRLGEVTEVKVVRGEHKILNRAALKLIKKSKLPPLPQSYKGESLTLTVSIGYALR